MKCKGIPVTEDGLQRLKMLEDMFLYPPRFRFEFSCTDTSLAQPRAEVTANLTGQLGPLQCKIPLSIDEAMLLIPATGWTSPISSPSGKLLNSLLRLENALFCREQHNSCQNTERCC